MELRHLRYFVAVAEEMNIHRAAARLNISQPPLSLSIQQLEAEIGVPLFTREGRGIQITRAGENYLVRARQILADSKKAGEEARQLHQGIAGTLKIGFVSSAITGILQKSVSAYKKRYPNVSLQINQSVSSRMGDELLNKEIDVAILRIPEDVAPGLKLIRQTSESWFVALPKDHPLTAKKEIRVKDLQKEKLIFYPRSNTAPGYDDVMNIFREKNVTPDFVQEATEQMTIAGLVGAGMGLGIVPECMASVKIANVVHRPLEGTKNRTGFAFVVRDEDDALVRQFLEMGD